MLAEEGRDMKSLFYDIHQTVMNTMERMGYPLRKDFSILGYIQVL